MRLWHYKMIPVLPRQQLLTQHRMLCAIRGRGYGKRNRLLDYVFTHSWECLYHYHKSVLEEMKSRGYKPNEKWFDFYYRGKNCKRLSEDLTIKTNRPSDFPEHTDKYLKTCIEELFQKLQNAKEGIYNQNEIYAFCSWAEEQGSLQFEPPFKNK